MCRRLRISLAHLENASVPFSPPFSPTHVSAFAGLPIRALLRSGLRKSRHPATMRIALRRHAKRYRLGCARASFPPRHILDQESERNNLMNRRCFLRALAAAPAVGLAPIPLVFPWDAIAQSRGGGMAPADPFKPSDEANSPIGAGRGIHPGRVVWVRDAKATTWDGTTGHWWDDANTNQKLVNDMTSRVLLNLTGKKNGKQAWDALFRSFNSTHKLGGSGYRSEERIAIKINCNQDRSPEWGTLASRGGAARGGSPPRAATNGLPSPHAVVALVTELIEMGGVRGADILVYDRSGKH